MSDRVTGLGVTLEEYETLNGSLLLDDVFTEAEKRKKESSITECDCDDIDILDKNLLLFGEEVAKMDDLGYSVMGKFLGIPIPYLLKLPVELKNANCQYWLSQKSGKLVKVHIKDGGLIDITAQTSIERVDVLDILNNAIVEGRVINSVQQTNSTVLDIYSPIKKYSAGGRNFYAGVRAVLKDGLNAPDIVPIFVDIESCAVIECSSFVTSASIRGLAYADILREIQSCTSLATSAHDTLFRTYEHICDERIPDPRRRISLYCREHGLPDRIAAYALKIYDDMHMSGATYGDIIALFGGMGFVDEVKQASERKMQKLAGYIVLKSHHERRCSACDSRLLDE